MDGVSEADWHFLSHHLGQKGNPPSGWTLRLTLDGHCLVLLSVETESHEVQDSFK